MPAARALPLEILKELNLPVIFFMQGKTYLHFLRLCITLAVWTTALICSLLFLGSGKGLIP